MKYIGIIPARYASTRFPGKPLAMLDGKPIIQHVYEQVVNAFDETVVATDDERIAWLCKILWRRSGDDWYASSQWDGSVL